MDSETAPGLEAKSSLLYASIYFRFWLKMTLAPWIPVSQFKKRKTQFGRPPRPVLRNRKTEITVRDWLTKKMENSWMKKIYSERLFADRWENLPLSSSLAPGNLPENRETSRGTTKQSRKISVLARGKFGRFSQGADRWKVLRNNSQRFWGLSRRQ